MYYTKQIHVFVDKSSTQFKFGYSKLKPKNCPKFHLGVKAMPKLHLWDKPSPNLTFSWVRLCGLDLPQIVFRRRPISKFKVITQLRGYLLPFKLAELDGSIINKIQQLIVQLKNIGRIQQKHEIIGAIMKNSDNEFINK